MSKTKQLIEIAQGMNSCLKAIDELRTNYIKTCKVLNVRGVTEDDCLKSIEEQNSLIISTHENLNNIAYSIQNMQKDILEEAKVNIDASIY